MKDIYVFHLGPEAVPEYAEAQMILAVVAVECLFGKAAVRVGVRYALNHDKNAIVVESGNEAGEALVRVFTGFLIRVFGETAFSVEHTKAGAA